MLLTTERDTPFYPVASLPKARADASSKRISKSITTLLRNRIESQPKMIERHLRQKINGLNKMRVHLVQKKYNKINSPDKKYNEQDKKQK